MTDLSEMLRAQADLQVQSYGKDPRMLSGEERAEFLIWNVVALEDELHEAMQEAKWKPWLTSTRGDWVDRDAYVGELVDAFHFFMNLLLLADCSAEEFATRYFIKRGTNARRQAEGYTGEKDGAGRELDRTEFEVPHPFDDSILHDGQVPDRYQAVLEQERQRLVEEHLRRQRESLADGQ